jgi:hypothetical protein
MVDFARLVLAADTSQMKTAAGDIDRVTKAGEGAEGMTTGLASGMKKAAMAAAALGVAAATAAVGMTFRNAIREAEQLERNMMRTQAVIQATGGVAGRSADQLLAQARALAAATLASTEGITQAQQTLLTFRNIRGEVFDQAIEGALDLAAAMGTDLNSATLQLAKALEDPITGMTALTRSGTVFTDAQKDVVKEMVNTGRAAEAQKFILAELAAQYGGVAAAEAKGLAGAQDTLRQAIQETLIALSDTLRLTERATAFYNGLAVVVRGVGENMERLAFYVGAAAVAFTAAMTPAIIGATLAAGRLVAALVLTRAALLRTGIGALVIAAGELAFRFSKLVEGAGGFGKAMGLLKAVAVEVFERIRFGAGSVDLKMKEISWNIQASWLSAMKAMQQGWARFLEAVAGTVRGTFLEDSFSGIVTAADRAAGAVDALSDRIAYSEAVAASAAKGSKALADAVTAPLKSMEALRAATDGVAESTEDGAAAAAALATALEGGAGSLAGGAGAAADALTDTNKTADDLAETLSGPLTSAVDGVANAFADFMMRGFRDFKSFAAGIVNSFKRMLAEMIATAARNRIMLSIGMGGGLAGTAANAAPGILGSMGGGAGLAGMAGGSGLMGGLGNALGGGLGNVFSVGANAAAAGGGALATIGAAIPVIGAVALAFAAFRKTTKTLDSGLRVTVKNMDALVETFKKVETSRFFGLSKSKSTSFSDASDDVADPIIDAIRAIQSSVSGMADSLGIGADAFDDFSFQFNVSLRKLNDEQKQAAIQAGFQKFTDAMAQTALAAGGLDVELEGAAARMDALASSLGAVNQTMRFLARDLFDVSIAGAQAAEQLIGFFGGFDNFNATQQSYFENFYSEQERISLRFAELTRNFETLGLEAEGLAISLPETNAAFRALVEAQDLTTEAGRGAYAALLLLSGEFASLQDATGSLEGAVSGLSDAMAAEVRGLQRQLFQLQGNIAAVRDMTLADLQSDEARAIQLEIFALQDKQAKSANKLAGAAKSASSATDKLSDALRKAEAIAKEREKLERTILGLEGNVIELRRRELTEVDASNRALQSRIWLLEDEAKVTSEREGLERRLLELQGNVAELRRRELAGLDATNQGLQLAIWKLEDFNSALRGLNQNDFATLVDFNRAAALEANRLQSSMSGLGVVDDVIFQTGEAFTVASGALTLALEDMVSATDRLIDNLAEFTAELKSMNSPTIEPEIEAVRVRGQRFTPPRQTFQPTGDMRGEVIELKEYVRELVKINHKQERTLKEIQLQGETA